MISDVFVNINKIIERDIKVSTYKFALLRGVIDIVQDNSPYMTIRDDRVWFPTGLLIEKWLLYYYPILESTQSIPQIYGSANLAFESHFRKIIDFYARGLGFSAFYNDLRNMGIPDAIQPEFIDLVRSMQRTVTGMPMRYIGRSISSEYYSIFTYENPTRGGARQKVDIEWMVRSLGRFSIPYAYYTAFNVLGSFINGQDSILFKWAEFSVNASGQRLSFEQVVNEVLKSPITDRDVRESKQIYQSMLGQEGKVYCVWTGNQIKRYDIDHVIPFSVMRNNDLWNLLPSDPKTNNKKRDKIPSPYLIEKQRDLISHYWDLLSRSHPTRFRKEIQVSLIGTSEESVRHEIALKQLSGKCEYLISSRGFEEWTG